MHLFTLHSKILSYCVGCFPEPVLYYYYLLKASRASDSGGPWSSL